MATVLYVDDDEALRNVVRTWLERSGHEVHTAESVASARRLVSAHDFDGAFIDVWLDDGTGFELHGWLESHAPRLARRVVFVTGDVVAGTPARGRVSALGRPVLTKPFALAEMDPHVARWSAGEGEGDTDGVADEPAD
jgi:DNA-binding NtrC family response regulator